MESHMTKHLSAVEGHGMAIMVGKFAIARSMLSWSSLDSKQERSISLALSWAMLTLVSFDDGCDEVARLGGWKQTKEKRIGGN
jgi:hypothetical protein